MVEDGERSVRERGVGEREEEGRGRVEDQDDWFGPKVREGAIRGKAQKE